MNKFKELIPNEEYTVGDLVSAILGIDNEGDAKSFFDGYIQSLITDNGADEHYAEEVARANIGWCFGEGMEADRVAMWNAVCGASHFIGGIFLPEDPAILLEQGKQWAKGWQES